MKLVFVHYYTITARNSLITNHCTSLFPFWKLERERNHEVWMSHASHSSF